MFNKSFTSQKGYCTVTLYFLWMPQCYCLMRRAYWHNHIISPDFCSAPVDDKLSLPAISNQKKRVIHMQNVAALCMESQFNMKNPHQVEFCGWKWQWCPLLMAPVRASSCHPQTELGLLDGLIKLIKSLCYDYFFPNRLQTTLIYLSIPLKVLVLLHSLILSVWQLLVAVLKHVKEAVKQKIL